MPIRFRSNQTYSVLRLRGVWLFFVLIFAIVAGRLFYLQVLRYDDFRTQADVAQVKSLTIEANRGRIYAQNGQKQVPLVINETRWTMFSDTKFIDDAEAVISALENLAVSLTEAQQQALHAGQSRYVVLKKQVTADERTSYEEGLDGLRGVYFQKQSVRQYLEGALASQVLGFFNSELGEKGKDEQWCNQRQSKGQPGLGQYGIEQYYQQELAGTRGCLRATTDVHDVPLLFVEDNTLVEPIDGKDITLTMDVPMQRIVEDALKKGIVATESLSGTAIILDAEDGAVLAMANYPSFDPANFTEAEVVHYENRGVEHILEPASVVKVFLMAAALSEKQVDPKGRYYNPRSQTVDGRSINNFIFHEQGYLPVTDILSRSLNTGTVAMLQRLGKTGPKDKVDEGDRQVLYDYYRQAFRLGQVTGIDLPNEAAGIINKPTHRWSPNHLYATMTFGQSIAVTPLQLAAAYAAIFNGGSYWKPYVAAKVGDVEYQPKLLADNILPQEAINDLRYLMRAMGERNLPDVQYGHASLEISAKTGTAQVPDFEEGGYIDDVANGLMAGYVKSRQRTFAIVVVVEQPQVRFAGSQGAKPIWVDIVQNLVALGRTN